MGKRPVACREEGSEGLGGVEHQEEPDSGHGVVALTCRMVPRRLLCLLWQNKRDGSTSIVRFTSNPHMVPSRDIHTMFERRDGS